MNSYLPPHKKSSILFLIYLLFPLHNVQAQDQQLIQLSYSEIDSITATLYQKRDYRTAILYMQAARENAKQEFGEMDSTFALYTMNLVFFYQQVDQLKETERYYTQAKEIFEEIMGTQNANYMESSNNLATLYQSIGQLKKSEYYYIQNIKLAAKLYGEEHHVYASSLSNLATLYSQDLEEPEKAEPLVLKALKIKEKIYGKEHQQYATALHNLAHVYSKTKNYEKAESMFLQTISTIQKTTDPKGFTLAAAFSNLATLYGQTDEWKKAASTMMKASEIYRELLGEENTYYARTLQNTAVIYNQLGKHEEAGKLYKKALAIRKKAFGEFHPLVAITMRNMSKIYADKGDIKTANELLGKGLLIVETTLGKEHPSYAKTLNDIAALQLKTGNLDSALHSFKLSFDANSATIDSNFTKWSQIDEHDYYDNETINTSLKGFLVTLEAQYKLKKEKSTLELYYAINKAAIELNERIRNNFSGERDKLRSLATNNKFILQGIEKGILLGHETYQEDAFTYAEINKGALLMDAEKTTNAYKFGDLPDSLIQQEKQLQKEHSKLAAQLLEPRPKEEKEKLLKQLNETKLDINEFTQNLKKQYPKYLALKYKQKIATVKEIQESLNNKTALIEYVIGDSLIYAFYIDQEQITLHQIFVSSNILATRIKELHATLSNYELAIKNSNDSYRKFTSNSQWFYETIVAPLIKNKGDIKHLIIIPDGELGHLPFETFLVEEAPQGETDYHELHYLINDYKISYNYSATLWQNSIQRKNDNNKNRTAGNILAMASNYKLALDSTKTDWRLPVYQNLRKLLQPLPAARKEVETLEQSFNGFFGFDMLASEKEFKEKAGDFAIIHLAMHGLLNSKSPILSSLAFTEDSDSLENNFLHAYEISKMKLNAELVVLSACETGYGNFDKGNGIASLARAFTYAGASSLIVSLWQVNDFAASKVMENLYHNLTDGMEKDEALRQAKLQYMNSAKGIMAHPAFWSPFIQMGNTKPVHISRKGISKVWWIGGVVVFLLLGGFTLRKRKKVA